MAVPVMVFLLVLVMVVNMNATTRVPVECGHYARGVSTIEKVLEIWRIGIPPPSQFLIQPAEPLLMDGVIGSYRQEYSQRLMPGRRYRAEVQTGIPPGVLEVQGILVPELRYFCQWGVANCCHFARLLLMVGEHFCNGA